MLQEMPPLTKRQKQAKCQQASRAKGFSSSLIEDLLNVKMDPNYEPDDNDSDINMDSGSELEGHQHMTYSLFDGPSTTSNNSMVFCRQEIQISPPMWTHTNADAGNPVRLRAALIRRRLIFHKWNLRPPYKVTPTFSDSNSLFENAWSSDFSLVKK